MDRWLNIFGQELRYLLPPRSVREHARATNLVERHRSIDAFPFFWSFVVGTTQFGGSLAAVQDLYKAFTNDSVAYSSVQQWVTADLIELLTDARTQETTQLQIGEWVEDPLVLFDLGYLDYARLGRIDPNGGWFVSRLNVDANPEITDEFRTWCGNTIDLGGHAPPRGAARPLSADHRFDGDGRCGSGRSTPSVVPN